MTQAERKRIEGMVPSEWWFTMRQERDRLQTRVKSLEGQLEEVEARLAEAERENERLQSALNALGGLYARLREAANAYLRAPGGDVESREALYRALAPSDPDEPVSSLSQDAAEVAQPSESND